jgi:hypothetical protein
MTNPYRAMCAELAEELVNEYGYCTEWEEGLPLCGSMCSELLTRARALLAQPEPERPGDDETSNNGYEALCRQLIRDLAAARDALEAWTEYFTENEQPTAKSFCMKEYKSARDAYFNACTAMAVLRRPAL